MICEYAVHYSIKNLDKASGIYPAADGFYPGIYLVGALRHTPSCGTMSSGMHVLYPLLLRAGNVCCQCLDREQTDGQLQSVYFPHLLQRKGCLGLGCRIVLPAPEASCEQRLSASAACRSSSPPCSWLIVTDVDFLVNKYRIWSGWSWCTKAVKAELDVRLFLNNLTSNSALTGKISLYLSK